MKKIFLVLFFISMNSWAVTSNSIYNLKSTWTNQDGNKVELSSLTGRVRILTMVFTRCSSACPMTVGDIKAILAKLPAKVRDQVSVDLFSFDYERDQPDSLKAFAKKMKIETAQWNVYTGDKSSISDLAGALGVQYKKIDGGAYVHSSHIVLIDKQGEIVKTIEGSEASESDFNAEIQKAVGAK